MTAGEGLSRDRFKKGAAPVVEGQGLSGGSFGGSTPPESAPVVEAPAAPVVERPAAPVVEGPRVEVKPGALNPVAAALLEEIPDRPTKPATAAAAPVEQEAAPAAPDDLEEKAAGKKAPPVALFGAAALGVLGLLYGASRMRPVPTSAAPTAPQAPSAPAAPISQGVTVK